MRVQIDLGAFSGKGWHEIDPDDRVAILAMRHADHLDRQNAPKSEAEQRREMQEQAKRHAAAALVREQLAANGSTPEGIALFMRDMQLG